MEPEFCIFSSEAVGPEIPDIGGEPRNILG